MKAPATKFHEQHRSAVAPETRSAEERNDGAKPGHTDFVHRRARPSPADRDCGAAVGGRVLYPVPYPAGVPSPFVSSSGHGEEMQILAVVGVVGVKDVAASLERIARDVEQAAVDVTDETLVAIEVTRRGAECGCGPWHWSRRCTSAGLAEWEDAAAWLPAAAPAGSVPSWRCGPTECERPKRRADPAASSSRGRVPAR